MIRNRGLSFLVASLLPFLGTAKVLAQTDGAELFESRVRPVLVESCFECHSAIPLADLHLDSRDGMLAGGVSGPAIVPGDPDASLLIQAIRHARDDLRMPMDGDLLSERAIADIAEWVRMGAPWPATSDAVDARPAKTPSAEDRAFWSFAPIGDPDVPRVTDESWPTTDIDRFVLAKLEKESLEPAPAADRRTLIRRANFDLIGLPPTPEEVEAFVNDPSPDAFEKVIDRLLASPHYGERWGRHWIDVVRFGEDDPRALEPKGTGREVYPQAYVYRDWVVAAFNEDLPYDEFVRAQIAADFIEDDRRRTRALPGLGFLGGGPWFYDGPEPPIARADERNDRVDVTTRGFLGVTVACARCHDHKYDPFTMEDYYGLAGVFSNTDYHEYPLAPESTVAEYEERKEHLEGLEKRLKTYLTTAGEQLARVLNHQSSRYMVASFKVTGEPEMPVEEASREEELDLEMLERWVSFLAKEPDNYPYLQDWQAMIAGGGTLEEAERLGDEFQRLLDEILDEKERLREKNAWIIANGSRPPDEQESIPLPNDFESAFDLHQLELETMDRERFNLWIDVFRNDLEGPGNPLEWWPGLFTFQGWGLERRLGRASADHVVALRQEIEELEESLSEHYPFVMGVKDKQDEDLRDLAIHLRGNPKILGAATPRRFPLVLGEKESASFDTGSGRRELAEAIVNHPLSTRVLVNRVWRWHFGTGIVDTPSNFGRLGERPTHPELLEYLARDFLSNERSIKELHRKIMRSSVYRLAAVHSDTSYEKDPENRLYWRANARRLDAEAIRDSLLFVSGTLDEKVGGRSLELTDPENNRRTIYSKISRHSLDGYLQTFDVPSPSITAEKRFTTNVPLQSLFFMNSEFVYAQARHLVHRLSTEDEDTEVNVSDPDLDRIPDDEKIRRAYRHVYGRDAEVAEVRLGVEFLDAGEQPRLDGWIQYARALLSSNEFRYVN